MNVIKPISPVEPAPSPARTDRREFSAPFSLETCVERLRSHHESPKLITWRGRLRTRVKVQRVDPVTYRFVIQQTQKNVQLVYYGVGPRLSGTLHAQPDGSTLVRLRVQAGSTAVLLYSLMMGMLFPLIFIERYGRTLDEQVLMVLFGLGVALFVLVVAWFWNLGMNRQLAALLKSSLGVGELE